MIRSGQTLEYHMWQNGNILKYKKKQKSQKIQMLGGSVEMVMGDKSMTTVYCFRRIEIISYEEYLVLELLNKRKKKQW